MVRGAPPGPAPPGQTQEVAVAREPAAQGGAQPGQLAAVAQQQVVAAQRARRQHHRPAADRPAGIRFLVSVRWPSRVGLVDDVFHPVPARGQRLRCRRPGSGCAPRPRPARPPTAPSGPACSCCRSCSRCRIRRTGGRCMRVRPYRLGAAPGSARPRADRRPEKLTASGSQLVRQPRPPGRLGVFARLGGGQPQVGRQRVGADQLLDGVVVGFQIPALQRPVHSRRPSRPRDEPVLVLAEQDVGVDQRAAAQPAGDQRRRCRRSSRRRTGRAGPRWDPRSWPSSSAGLRGNAPGGYSLPRSSTQTRSPACASC